MDCALVCATISDGDGRALRGRALRAHLRACEPASLRACGDCRDFKTAISDRQAKLAALAPAMPSAAAAGLLESVLAGSGGGIGGAGLVTGLGASMALKSLATLATLAAVGTLGAGVLRAVGPDGAQNAGGETRSTPIPHPKAPAPPAPSTHRVPARSQTPLLGSAKTAARRKKRHADAGHRAAPDARPTRESGEGPHIGTPAVQETAVAEAPATPAVPTPAGGGPVRELVSRPESGNHPIRREVSAIRPPNLPTVPEVRAALPVKVPPLPIHPKRRRDK